MMKTYIKIFVATLMLLAACKTQKLVVQNDVSQTPVTIIQPKADTVNYNYPTPRQYSVPKKIFKELENYETAFDELKAMLEGTKEPNFERAVFISENPYYNNLNKYADFQQNIDFHLYFIKLLIKDNDKSDSIDFNVKVNQYGRFNLDDIRHMPDEKKDLYKKSVANWAIFTYLTDTIYLGNRNNVFHKPYSYSSHDPFGIKDWSNSQVINLLYSKEQKGNCFALTAFFKILSDRLKSDARICTAPQHIYIQHRDKKGDYYNVELATAGHPGDGTIQTLTHTTTEAIKSGIALRSFDAKQSIGLCLVNLAKSYEHKFGSKDDNFLLKCAELVLTHDPLNLNALLLKQQVLDERVTSFALENNISDINKLKTNAETSQTFFDLENHLALLYRLGYRQMPYDMQKIIMTGIFPKDFKDKNPSPFTTIDPKDEHRKKFTTLYGGLFQEVFEIKEFESYGHFTFQTTTNKITVVDTTAQTGFLIDPVAFAYDFGARMYDARLGRFLSVDPKTAQNASWTPYSYAVNNPIVFVDVKGEWPGITFMYFEFDVGLGLGYGLNYVEQSGIAYDEVGKTHFTMTSALYIVNQSLEESSSNPQLIAGASIGFTGNIKQNWSAETFGGLVGKGGLGLPIPISADIGLGVAINAGFNSDEFVLGAGIGAGLKISYVNTSIKQSISLTDNEASIINNATDVVSESWIITGQTAIKDKSGNITGYQASVATKNTKGELINTGIKVNSGVNKDAKGNTTSNGVWSSSAYQKEASEAEKEDKR